MGPEKEVFIGNDKQGTLIFSTPDLDTVLKVTRIKSIKIEGKNYNVTAYRAPHEDSGAEWTGDFSSIAGSTSSHCCFVKYFSVQDIDSIFAKYFLLGLAAALVTLIIAPNNAGAIPPGVVETAANALSQAFGRNEESAEE
ncbi:hypothetical protein MRX96_040487 [Rhipicephalus microplus]